ncbi:MAG: hypothetical protein J7M25_01715 [Deltaproteobacteria bacterium]|nr:hypothetical protein [Deltaproteobacteria bacterium]
MRDAQSNRVWFWAAGLTTVTAVMAVMAVMAVTAVTIWLAGCRSASSTPAWLQASPSHVRVDRDLSQSQVNLFWVNREEQGQMLVVAAVSPDALVPPGGDLTLVVRTSRGSTRTKPFLLLDRGPHAALFHVRVHGAPLEMFLLRGQLRGQAAQGTGGRHESGFSVSKTTAWIDDLVSTDAGLTQGRYWLLAQKRIRPLPMMHRGGVWPVRRQWTPGMERLYSAWIAHLFDVPGRKSWRPLHQVVRRPEQNFLYDVLGLAEDSGAKGGNRVALWGDCADVAYMVRTYFSWKMRLPMRFGICSRGSGRHGPRCRAYGTNLTDHYDHIADPVARFDAFVRRDISWQVHSGTTRTLPADTHSDFYPISVTRKTLVPGVVYVDPGGHVLVVTRVEDGNLTAIDGHPDMTVTVRHFSHHQFFPVYVRLMTGGFKAFRPVRYEQGRIVVRRNRDLGPNFSLEQYSFRRPEAYYRFVEARLRQADPSI